MHIHTLTHEFFFAALNLPPLCYLLPYKKEVCRITDVTFTSSTRLLVDDTTQPGEKVDSDLSPAPASLRLVLREE